MKTIAHASSIVLVLVVLNGQAPARPDTACERLASLSMPHATIAAAEQVTTGTFAIPATSPPGPGPAGQRREFSGLPAFCRVAADLMPTTDSDIKLEVWMPLSPWNHKFMAAGNGGWSGAVNYAQMVPILQRGYAVASTDTGHQSSSQEAHWAMGHPEKQIDFGYRAVHEMTGAAKQVIATFYGAPPARAYWNGCSSGGKQGLKEAQRFPADYDGIIAGAPANYWTHLSTQIIFVAQAVRGDPAGGIPQSKYPLIHDAVLRQCDALDGVKDGLLEDPRRCDFKPASLACEGPDEPTCLTRAQVAALEKVYAPVRNSKGTEIFPGLAIGGEAGWGPLPQPFAIAENHFKYVVFGDPAWDFRTLNVDRDLAKADRIDQEIGQLNANDPDLSAFRRRGGKILQYHGWNDQQIAPQNSINYYESVVARTGNRGAVEEFYRLFMVPGMMHCQGGDGATDQFDKISALEQWVERGVAPATIMASHLKDGKADRTRPLCAYPAVAKYKGAGDTDDAANFSCVKPH